MNLSIYFNFIVLRFSSKSECSFYLNNKYFNKIKYLARALDQVGYMDREMIHEYVKQGWLTLNDDTVIDWEVDEKYAYLYNEYWDDLIDDDEPVYPQLNSCNSVKLLKDNFLEIFQQWNEQVLKDNPEFVLLWQDEQDVVYLETFESEDLVKNRVDEVKRVVGFLEK